MPAHKLSTDAERHRRYVDRLSTPDGCWPWTGYVASNGYGVIGIGSRAAGTFKNEGAHRFALEQALGRPLLPGMQALHTCDFPACQRDDEHGFYEVNGVLRPRRGHLWEGTTQDNTADKMRKGREASGALNGVYLHPERYPRGEAQWFAKLTADQVREIRRRVAAGERQNALAAEYGIGCSQVNRIVKRTTWRHV